MKLTEKKTLNAITKALLLSSSVCFYSACTSTPKTVEGVNQLTELQHYEQALSTYQELTPEQQQLIDLKQIQNKKNRYEKQLISNANKKQKVMDFDGAEATLREGQQNIPSSTAIQQATEKLAQAKKQYTDKYQRFYDIEYAHFLIKEKPLLEKLSVTENHKKSFKRYSKKQLKERSRISEIIGSEGIEALQKKKYTLASNLLNMAQELNPDMRWQQGLAAINKKDNRARSHKARIARQQKKKAVQQQQLAQKETDRKISTLKQSFKQAITHEDIHQATINIQNIENLAPQNSQKDWLNSSQKQLDELTDKKLQETLTEGKILYSKGKINAAITTWKQALSYAPHSLQLNEHIQRAETFQARFKELAR